MLILCTQCIIADSDILQITFGWTVWTQNEKGAAYPAPYYWCTFNTYLITHHLHHSSLESPIVGYCRISFFLWVDKSWSYLSRSRWSGREWEWEGLLPTINPPCPFSCLAGTRCLVWTLPVTLAEMLGYLKESVTFIKCYLLTALNNYFTWSDYLSELHNS